MSVREREEREDEVPELRRKIEALKAGYGLMSAMVWKFCDMSYLEDDPDDPDNAIIEAADQAMR